MAVADATIQLGGIFLETADGTRITLGQLKAPFSISFKPAEEWEKPSTPIQIGSTVRISDAPKMGADGYVDPTFAGKEGIVIRGPEEGDWAVSYDGRKQWIAAEHLTVVA